MRWDARNFFAWPGIMGLIASDRTAFWVSIRLSRSRWRMTMVVKMSKGACVIAFLVEVTD